MLTDWIEIPFEEFGLQVHPLGTAGDFRGWLTVSANTGDVIAIDLEIWLKKYRDWKRVELPKSHPLFVIMEIELPIFLEDEIADAQRDYRESREDTIADMRRDAS
jgi:hypothetical protein